MDIQELVKQTIENVKAVAETESVVGKPIINGDGTIILPVSKLSFGFVAGGGEYGIPDRKADSNYPAARASGAGVTVTPIGFLICGREKKFISVDNSSTTDNKWADLARAAYNAFKNDKNEND